MFAARHHLRGGSVEAFEPGAVVEFDPEVCGPCRMRAKCTQAASGRGLTVTMADDEALQKALRRLQATPAGREKLHTCVDVEHRLAHLSNRQGPRARYRGLRKNTFDLRRQSANSQPRGHRTVCGVRRGNVFGALGALRDGAARRGGHFRDVDRL